MVSPRSGISYSNAVLNLIMIRSLQTQQVIKVSNHRQSYSAEIAAYATLYIISGT